MKEISIDVTFYPAGITCLLKICKVKLYKIFVYSADKILIGTNFTKNKL